MDVTNNNAGGNDLEREITATISQLIEEAKMPDIRKTSWMGQVVDACLKAGAEEKITDWRAYILKYYMDNEVGFDPDYAHKAYQGLIQLD